MKKLLLTFVAGVSLASSVFAQNYAAGMDGVGIELAGVGAGYCTYNSSSAPALYWPGHNITAGDVAQASSPSSLQLTSHAVKDLANDGGALWGLVKVNGLTCDYIWNQTPTGIDMSATANKKAKLLIKADGAASVALMLGNSSAGGWPAIEVSAPIALTSSWQQIDVDFSAASAAVLSNVNVWGFKTDMYAGNVYVRFIGLGSVNTVPVALGTTSSELPTSVTYGPNPSSSQIKVELSSLNLNDATLKLMNSNGSVVKEVNNATSVSVEGLNAGLYFLQINNYKPVKVVVE